MLIDPETAALTASCVALLVGGSGVGATLWVASRNRLAGLQLQYAGDRSRALVRVLQLLETSRRGADNRVFNLTEARREDDPVTGEEGDPYAPQRRPHAERDFAAEAEARALIGAYGDLEMDTALLIWIQALDAIDAQFDVAEYNYFENQLPATAGQFAIVSMEASAAHGNLRMMIRDTIRVEKPARLKKLRHLQGR